MNNSRLPAYDVFLSYRRADRVAVAELASCLAQDGFDVFFDEWSIPVGYDITKAIERGLETSAKIVAFITPAYVSSEWGAYEMNYHWDECFLKGHGNLIPLLVGTSPESLPRRLQKLKWIEFENWRSLAGRYELLRSALLDLDQLTIGPLVIETREQLAALSLDELIVRKARLSFQFADEVKHAVSLALTELTLNALDHSGASPRAVITIRIDAQEIAIEVADKGNGFDLVATLENCRRRVEAGSLESRGRGLLLVRAACDFLENAAPIDVPARMIAKIRRHQVVRRVTQEGTENNPWGIDKAQFKHVLALLREDLPIGGDMPNSSLGPLRAHLLVKGKGTFRNSTGMKDFAKECINRGVRAFLFDVTECYDMDSTFLGTLAGIVLRLRQINQWQPPGFDVALVNCSEFITDLLVNLGYDGMLYIAKSHEDAVHVLERRLITTAPNRRNDTVVRALIGR